MDEDLSHPRLFRRCLGPSTVVNVAFLVGIIVVDRARVAEPTERCPTEEFADRIVQLQRDRGLVGLGTVVMVDGRVVAAAVSGERRLGDGYRIEMGDRWHLGSITKSITATLIGRLVEAGKMRWTETVGERFVGLRTAFPTAAIHEKWKSVTLQQLLTHTAGAPANLPWYYAFSRPAAGEELTMARRKAVFNVLANEPRTEPDIEFAYSNVGYVIAGAMAEIATGETWRDLVRINVFQPLNLASAGFGPPTSAKEHVDQPFGHAHRLGWKVPAGDDSDNTPLMSPAGITSMSLQDLCAYGHEHLRGHQGKGLLLTAETYQRLHSPVLNNYAYGWIRRDASADVPYSMYWHNGSNTMWYAVLVLVPDKKLVIAVTSNDGDIESADAAAQEIITHATGAFGHDARTEASRYGPRRQHRPSASP